MPCKALIPRLWSSRFRLRLRPAGSFIRTKIVEPAGLSVTAAAALRVSRPALSSLLNGKADLSGDGAAHREGFRELSCRSWRQPAQLACFGSKQCIKGDRLLLIQAARSAAG
jgi:hypothetical protein